MAYQTPFDPMQHVVAVFGDVRGGEGVPVRIHREQPVLDLFGRVGGAKTWVDAAVSRFKAEGGRGILMFLRNPVVDDLTALPEPDEAGKDGERHGSARHRMQRWREVGVGAQILRDLGIRSIVTLSTRERSYVGLAGFGIEIARTVLLDD